MAAPSAAQAITPSFCGARHGGNGGGSFFTGWTTDSFLAQIVVWHGNNGFGNVVNGIEPVWCRRISPDQVSCGVELIGRQAGTRSSFGLNWEAGERVNFVQGRSGKYVDALQFQTNWRNWSGWFGGQGGGFFSEAVSGSLFYNDFWGTSGMVVDSIGFCSSWP